MKWDERYSEAGFAYGKAPNDFLKATVDAVNGSGKALCLAEGEGRNGLYLARLGYQVKAVDLSKVGLEKARSLAAEEGLTIATEVCDLANWPLGEQQWDLIVSIWAHTPAQVRGHIHSQVYKALKPGGLFILEAYTPANLGRGTGGPPSKDMLMTLKDLKEELKDLEIIQGEEKEREIQEGKYHNGLSAVVQLVARKPQSK